MLSVHQKSRRRYDIHGFIRIESDVDLKNSFFKVSNLNPNLIIDVVDGIGYNVSECNKVGWNFYGVPDGNFLYYHGVRSEVLIENIEDCTKLTVNKAFFNKNRGKMWNSLLSAVISLKLLQNNRSFIHSACASIKNHAFLLAAFPDTGKSSTVLSIVKECENAEYLSDDLTIIDRNGNVYCYPIPMTMSSRVIGVIDKKEIGSKCMLKFKFCSFLQRHLITNYLSSRFFKFPPKAYIWDIWKNVKIARKSKISAICLLEFGKRDEIKEVSHDYTLRRINLINWEIVRHLNMNPFIITYSYFNSKLELPNYINVHQKITEDFLDEPECFIIRSKNGMWHEIIKKQIIPCYI